MSASNIRFNDITTIDLSFYSEKKISCQEMKNALTKYSSFFDAMDFFDVYIIKPWLKFLKDNPDFKRLNITTEHGKILEFGGLNLFIHLLKSKSFAKDFLCFACNNLEDFEQALKDLKDSNFEGKISFVVRALNYENIKNQNHVTAVMIEKSKDAIQICIIDSIDFSPIFSKTSKNYKLNPTFSSQNLYVKINNAEFKNVKIFISKVSRQKDLTNCAIFSFNDIKCFFDNKIFFKELEKYGNLQQDEWDNQVYYINDLMPQHHKLTQSFSQLLQVNSYFHSTDLSSRLQVLNISTMKSKRRAQTLEINMKAFDRYYLFLYFITIYAKNFAEKTKQICTMYESKNLPTYLKA